jgi:RNA polymerase sigma factor (sigma-70 family)
MNINVIGKSKAEKNIKLVLKLAGLYCSRHHCKNILDDMIQVGFMGLMKAVEGFDKSKGFKFSTYASRWILSYMNKERIELTNMVHIHQGAIRDGIKHPEIVDSDVESYDEKFEINNYSESDVVDNLIFKDVMKLVDKKISKFDERHQKIFNLRHKKGLSYIEIAEKIGSCKQNAAQIDDRMVSYLRRDKDIQKLYSLYKEL